MVSIGLSVAKSKSLNLNRSFLDGNKQRSIGFDTACFQDTPAHRSSRRSALRPVFRLSFLMSDSGDPNALIQLKIIDSKGKSIERTLAKYCILVGRPAPRMSLDELGDALDLSQKHEPEAGPSRFVVGHRAIDLPLGVVVEDDLLHPRKSASGGNPEVPQFTSLDCARVPPPLPR